jgi:hypothetical protein
MQKNSSKQYNLILPNGRQFFGMRSIGSILETPGCGLDPGGQICWIRLQSPLSVEGVNILGPQRQLISV